jgi:hypothetical protein
MALSDDQVIEAIGELMARASATAAGDVAETFAAAARVGMPGSGNALEDYFAVLSRLRMVELAVQQTFMESYDYTAETVAQLSRIITSFHVGVAISDSMLSAADAAKLFPGADGSLYAKASHEAQADDKVFLGALIDLQEAAKRLRPTPPVV